MPHDRRCPLGGAVVDASLPVPVDVSEHDMPAVGDVVGCNRLRCERCGQWVRQSPGIAVPGVQQHLVELGASRDWGSLDITEPSPGSRLYACGCLGWLETTWRYTDDTDNDDIDDPELPWRCAGHPAPALPLDVDGLYVDAELDLAAIVRLALQGWAPDGARATQRDTPARWLCRLYGRLDPLPQAVVVARAVGQGVDDVDPTVRGAALYFFGRWPLAPGFEMVVDRAEMADADLRRGEPVRYGPNRTFERSLLQVLVARLGRGVPGELDQRVSALVLGELARPGAVSGPQGQALLEGVARSEPSALAARISSLESSCPGCWSQVLEAFERTGQTAWFGSAVAVLVAGGGVPVADVRAFLENGWREYSDWGEAALELLDTRPE